MVETHAKAPDRTLDAVLSALVPGAGQWNQGRVGPAVHFYIDTVLLAVLMIFAPSLKGLAVFGVVALAAWSAVDAYRARAPRAK